MRPGKKNSRSRACALLMATLLMTGQAMADHSPQQEENPGFFTMTADLVLVRPLMLGTTLIGGAIFLVSSPFAAAGGNLGQAADTLVKQPFAATFQRCLGCGFFRDDAWSEDESSAKEN